MPRPFAVAVALAVAMTVAPRATGAGDAPGSLPLPMTAAELAEAIGLHRADRASLPGDIVRFAFASPDGSNAADTRARAALALALQRTGRADTVPLPLSGDTWRTHILRADVPDERLAAAIFGRRQFALLYYALLGIEPQTLQWIGAHPAAIDSLARHAAVAAPYARSLRIRNDAVQTPGNDAREVWSVLVGADPAQPEAFIAKLFSLRAGRLAAFYDAVAHVDPARQAFAIGRAGDVARADRAWRVLEGFAQAPAPWSIADHPFLRPDVDLPVLLRAIVVDGDGTLAAPASRSLWSSVYREGRGGDGDVDADWLIRAVLHGPSAVARRRLDTFAFAQRAFARPAIDGDLAFVLQQQPRFAALLSLLRDNGVTEPAACAAAVRAASSIEDDVEAMVVMQSGLAIVDRARAAGTIGGDAARGAIAGLVKAATGKGRRGTLLAWISADLPALLMAGLSAEQPDLERTVIAGIAGTTRAPQAVKWEGQDYVADVGRAELRRLTRARKAQEEMPLDAAVEAARTRGLAPLSRSLAGIVYAVAMGDPAGRVINGGAVWSRHRFGGHGAAQDPAGFAWRVATEVFGAGGWHLNGSLLYLHVALAHMTLRRLDESEMPLASHLGTTDRRSIAMSIALADARAMTDEQRDAIAAALARGRARVSSLIATPGAIDDVVAETGIAEWRRNTIAWTVANDPKRLLESFTLAELYRAGGGAALDTWGTASQPFDGCLCLRMPAHAWEEALGRPSTGQLGTHLVDVMLRTADVLAARQLPAALARDVASFVACDALDRASPAWAGDWMTVVGAVRDIPNDRFDDFISALTAIGPLIPPSRGSQ
jgi:hypothetical protein